MMFLTVEGIYNQCNFPPVFLVIKKKSVHQLIYQVISYHIMLYIKYNFYKIKITNAR
jgi:hypothetical protein